MSLSASLLTLRCGGGIIERNLSPAITLSKRYRKPNLKHPRPPAMARRVLNRVTQPIIPPEIEILSETCTKRPVFKVKELNDYDLFLISILRSQLLDHAPTGLFAIFFIKNFSRRELEKFRIALNKQGFVWRDAGNRIFNEVVSNTKYSTLTCLYGAGTFVISHPEPQVKALLDIVNKVPQAYLLGAVVQDRLLSVTEVEEYSKYPDQLSMLSQTCGILSHPAQRITNLLNHHQENLVHNLQSYIDEKSKGA